MTDATMTTEGLRATTTTAAEGAARQTFGVDLGDKHSHVCALDAQGAVIEEGRLPTTEDGFRSRFAAIPRARVALEIGTHSPWISALLQELGHEVLVANARKLRAIYDNDSKSDRVDAEQLARFARVDPKLLSPIQHRDRATRADLAQLRSRAALVASRTQLVNHVRGCMKSFGARLQPASTAVFARRSAWQIPRELRPALVPILRAIARLTQQILSFERRIERLGNTRYPETRRLRQVNGVGPMTSLQFVLTLVADGSTADDVTSSRSGRRDAA